MGMAVARLEMGEAVERAAQGARDVNALGVVEVEAGQRPGR